MYRSNGRRGVGIFLHRRTQWHVAIEHAVYAHKESGADDVPFAGRHAGAEEAGAAAGTSSRAIVGQTPFSLRGDPRAEQVDRQECLSFQTRAENLWVSQEIFYHARRAPVCGMSSAPVF